MSQRILMGIGLCGWLLFSLIGQETAVSVSAQNPISEIHQLVNNLRASYGLSPLTYNNQLAVAAQNQANWMAANNVYSHTGAGGSRPQGRANAAGYQGYVSENIVGGTNLTPSQGVVWWQNSPVHFNSIISTRYTEVGIGFATGFEQNFYAMVIGVPSNQPVTGNPRPATGNNTPPIAVAPIQLSEPKEDGSIVHTLQPGHTLWAVAARYEVSIADLLLYNQIAEDAFLQPGDTLIIQLAEGQLPPPTPTPPAHHVVQAGDTAWTIAAWYNVDLAELLWINGFAESVVLQPGEEVRVRLLAGESPPPTATPQLFHTVAQGETLWGIALLHGLTLEQILTYNNISQDALLRIGDLLQVVPPTPQPTATIQPVQPTQTHTQTPAQTPAQFPVPNLQSPSPSPTREETAVSSLSTPAPPAPEQPTSRWQQTIARGSVIAGVVLALFAVGGVWALRRMG